MGPCGENSGVYVDDGDRKASDGCGRLTDGRGRWLVVDVVVTDSRWAVAGLRCGLCGVAVVDVAVVAGAGTTLEMEERLAGRRVDEDDATWGEAEREAAVEVVVVLAVSDIRCGELSVACCC